MNEGKTPAPPDLPLFIRKTGKQAFRNLQYRRRVDPWLTLGLLSRDSLLDPPIEHGKHDQG